MPRLLATVFAACLVAAALPVEAQRSPILPGAADAAFATIQGNALTATDDSLADAIVRLRDARYGFIVGTTVTDRAGLFEFRTVDPGSYVVELLAPDQVAVLAASQVLTVEAGQTVSAVVKMPIVAAPLAGFLGGTPGTAAAVLAEAALAGVMTVQASGVATCDVLQ